MSKPIRILLIHPIGVDYHNEHDRQVASTAVSPTTEIVVRNLTDVPPTAYLSSEDILLSPLLKAVKKAEQEGFDAVGITCSGDPGVRIAKNLVSIPVTGPFESAARIGSSYGRYSVLYLNIPSGPNENLPQNGSWVQGLAREFGSDPFLASHYPVHVPRPDQELDEGKNIDPKVVVESALNNMRKAIWSQGPDLVRKAYVEDGARAVFIACSYWSGVLNPLRDAAPVAILDPIRSLASHCEFLARARVRDDN